VIIFSYPLFDFMNQGKIFPGMFFGKELFLFSPVHMCIDLSGCNGTVAEEGLDVFYVHIPFQQKGGKGMTEYMRCYSPGNACPGTKPFYDSPDRLV
jgi:hypothetical protein